MSNGVGQTMYVSLNWGIELMNCPRLWVNSQMSQYMIEYIEYEVQVPQLHKQAGRCAALAH